MTEKTIYYKGDEFKTRIHAQWAVFLTKLNIKYVYEERVFYLPDLKHWMICNQVWPSMENLYSARDLAMEKKEHVGLFWAKPSVPTFKGKRLEGSSAFVYTEYAAQTDKPYWEMAFDMHAWSEFPDGTFDIASIIDPEGGFVANPIHPFQDPKMAVVDFWGERGKPKCNTPKLKAAYTTAENAIFTRRSE